METIANVIKELEAARHDSEECPICKEEADSEFEHVDMHIENALEMLKVKP